MLQADFSSSHYQDYPDYHHQQHGHHQHSHSNNNNLQMQNVPLHHPGETANYNVKQHLVHYSKQEESESSKADEVANSEQRYATGGVVENHVPSNTQESEEIEERQTSNTNWTPLTPPPPQTTTI